jgi:cytochrome c biogenesis protein CcmG/thiol:disulfide interchange protein DsbE
MEKESAPPTAAQKGHRTRVLVLAAVVVFAVLIGYGLLTVCQKSGPLSEGQAPSFSLPLLDGGQFSLESQRGRVVVLNFWASWCVPCRREAPVLARAWENYRDKGVVFVGIAYQDTESKAREFIDLFAITYPNGLDERDQIAKAYRIRGVPETFFVTRDGQVKGVHVGPISEDTLTAKLEALLHHE